MPDLTPAIGQLRITPLFWCVLPALVFSSFSFWRKLKEDYKEEAVFALNLLLLAGAGVFYALSFFLLRNKGFSFPVTFAGVVLILKMWSLKTKSNVWEIFDALALSFIYFLFFVGVGYFASTGSYWDLKYIGAALVSWTVYEFSKNKYRSFSWYKSGKTGFLFWEASFVVFLVLSVLAFADTDALYLESVILVLMAIASARFIYYRAERSLKDDLKHLFGKK